MNYKALIGSIITLILLLAGANYILLLPLSLGFFSSVAVIAVTVAILGLALSFLPPKRPNPWGLGVAILVIVSVGIYVFSTSSIFRASDYRKLIGEVKEKTFSTDISLIDLTQLPVVDKDLARNLADKKLGEQVSLGSQVTIGYPTVQNVNDKLVWVVPLVHSGFFKWWSNSEGTPGYIIVSATNPQDVKLIDKLNEKAIKIKYQPEAFFGDDLRRFVYSNGHKNMGLTDLSFELDDSGKPYWVITKYRNTIGFNGEDILGVVVVDAQNGEISDYDVKDTPQWVDRIFPEPIIEDRLNDWGRYVNGWWNPSNKDMLKLTEGMNVVYNNGIAYYYSGLTSVGADESTVGFVLTNTKTGEATFYKVAGATEIASVSSAEGKVQNLGYEGTFPILVNVQNVPTYFTTLKDKKGLVKLYALVSVEDYNIVGTGETTKQALENYVKGLSGKGNWMALESSGKTVSLQGTVLRIGPVVNDNTTYYYILLKEQPEIIFSVPFDISNELPLTQSGDKVSLNYVEAKGYVVNVNEFDNLEFIQKKTEPQSSIEAENQKVTEGK